MKDDRKIFWKELRKIKAPKRLQEKIETQIQKIHSGEEEKKPQRIWRQRTWALAAGIILLLGLSLWSRAPKQKVIQTTEAKKITVLSEEKKINEEVISFMETQEEDWADWYFNEEIEKKSS